MVRARSGLRTETALRPVVRARQIAGEQVILKFADVLLQDRRSSLWLQYILLERLNCSHDGRRIDVVRSQYVEAMVDLPRNPSQAWQLTARGSHPHYLANGL